MKALHDAGRTLAKARQAQQAAMQAAEAEARKALAHGATEVEVAKTLGVNRMTVRKWAGKR